MGWHVVNLELSEEQTAVRRLARDFVEREIAPHAAEWDRAEDIDRSIVKKLGDIGFLGLTKLLTWRVAD